MPDSAQNAAIFFYRYAAPFVVLRGIRMISMTDAQPADMRSAEHQSLSTQLNLQIQPVNTIVSPGGNQRAVLKDCFRILENTQTIVTMHYRVGCILP